MLAVCGVHLVLGLLNGVAETPPMGWLSWQRYRCVIDCNATAKDCFNERLIRDTADAMVANGYKEAGYEYVCLDDCWQAPTRKNGHVVADPKRFPSGIKALADYVHGKGLKLGLYTALSEFTCAQHSAKVGLNCDFDNLPECETAKRDIEDFVSWDIDHLKVDGCFKFDVAHMNRSYEIVGNYLANATKHRGTPLVYHPSNLAFGFPRQFRELSAIANQWRFFDDVQASWESVQSIIEEIGAGQPECIPGPLPANCSGRLRSNTMPTSTYCASFCVERDNFLSVPGRGAWHDPDMLLVGNTNCSSAKQANPPHGLSCGVLSHDEEKTQMAVWAMAAAPLQMGNDLTAVPNISRSILLNPEVIAVDQDPLGRAGFRFLVDRSSGAQGWRKDLAGGSVAIALVNMGAAAGNGQPPAAGVDDCGWNHSVGSYREACGGAGGDIFCGELGADQVARQRCCADPDCRAFSIATGSAATKPKGFGCMKTNFDCGTTTKAGYDGYVKVKQGNANGLNISFDFSAVGFAPDTHVRVRDLFERKDLGIFVGSYTTQVAVPLHGVQMLELVYEPNYNRREL